MTRETKEKWIIAIVAPLALLIIGNLINNITNAASKNDLELVKTESKSYVDDQIKAHENNDKIRYEGFEEKLNTVYQRQEYMYLRELKKSDNALYLKELATIKKNKNPNL
jgi:uncharacterized membrane-anchored protein YhcB (DUF1043 family)